jgi:serine/threonine protein kinase
VIDFKALHSSTKAEQLSKGLSQVIKRCTQLDPNQRYQTTEELEFALVKLEKKKATAHMARVFSAGAGLGALCWLFAVYLPNTAPVEHM